MAVRIRLRRMGTKKLPFYRIVVSDSRSPQDGRFIERIGYYDPKTSPPKVEVDQKKAKAWLQKGAQASQTVKRLFKAAGMKMDELKSLKT
ncbi:MAG: 30S ribosomal protein S16 [Armatimonadetes bacterium CG07_land_8_20_14_0_80_40_9]|nr:MAG: 30S ribosomal protein S16 [Armatimonadetes bacterium CG07_land_8_20_14_0_80_40_9]